MAKQPNARNEGMALIMAVFFIGVALVVVGALLTRSLQQRKVVDQYEDYTTSYQGVEAALSHVAQASHGRTVTIEHTDDILLVRIDVHLIMQVLTNLIMNAFKYTPEDSTVTISARREGAFVVVDVASTLRASSGSMPASRRSRSPRERRSSVVRVTMMPASIRP